MNNFKRISVITISAFLLLTSVSHASTGKVNSKTVRVREKASTSSEIITNVYRNDEVEILSKEGDWYKVKVDGNTGYIRSDFLTVSSDESNTSSSAETNDNSNSSANLSTTSKVKVRALPSIISVSVGDLDSGKEIDKLDEINNWVKVTDGTVTGWVLNNKIGEKTENTEPVEEPNNKENDEKKEEKPEEKKEEKKEETSTKTSEINKKGIVNVKTARVRSSASSTGNNIIDLLDYNDEVTVLSKEGTWYKISYNGKEGYVSSDLITMKDEQGVSSRSLVEDRQSAKEEKTQNTVEEDKTEENSTPVQENKTSGQAVVDFAMKYMGYPYVAAGKKPETGFDCSGFTSYVYSNFGVSLGASSASQKNNGTEVSRSNLVAGDLVIFYDEGFSKIGHVGIYIGNGDFIHAANPQKGVVIDNINTSSYYNSRYVTARRIF